MIVKQYITWVQKLTNKENSCLASQMFLLKGTLLFLNFNHIKPIFYIFIFPSQNTNLNNVFSSVIELLLPFPWENTYKNHKKKKKSQAVKQFIMYATIFLEIFKKTI